MKRVWLSTRFPLACFAITMVLMGVGIAAGDYFGDRALPVTLFIWMIAMLPLAVSFYRMRRRHRVYYGVFELVAACALFYVTMQSIIHRGAAAPMSFETIATRSITFLALVYFMVRALDNIGEGLKRYPTWEAWWDKIFPKA
jgi:hypothetical protein